MFIQGAERMDLMGPQRHDIFVIAASGGGVEALQRLVSELPADLAAAVFIVLHVGDRPSRLPSILSKAGPLPAFHPVHGQPIECGRIYIAPPDRHMRLQLGFIHLDRGPKVRHTRPAADPLFQSAAEAYGARVVGVVLTGADSDGSNGSKAIEEHGGLVIAQQPVEAPYPSMPLSVLREDDPDYVLSLDEIAPLLVSLSKGQKPQPSASDVANEEAGLQQSFARSDRR